MQQLFFPTYHLNHKIKECDEGKYNFLWTKLMVTVYVSNLQWHDTKQRRTR